MKLDELLAEEWPMDFEGSIPDLAAANVARQALWFLHKELEAIKDDPEAVIVTGNAVLALLVSLRESVAGVGG